MKTFLLALTILLGALTQSFAYEIIGPEDIALNGYRMSLEDIDGMILNRIQNPHVLQFVWVECEKCHRVIEFAELRTHVHDFRHNAYWLID